LRTGDAGWRLHATTRARQDDLLRALPQETLIAYNQIKRLRRLLKAETADDHHGHVQLELYDRTLPASSTSS